MSTRQIIGLSSALAVIIGASLTVLLLKGAFPTPFSDEFYFFRIYIDAKNGTINPAEVFRPHFGHIYALLKLWLWLVVHLGIDWRLSMYAQVALVAVAAGLVSRYSRSADSKPIDLLLAIAVALAIGSTRQAENLYWAIQVSAAAMLLSSIVAFYFLSKYFETQKGTYAGLAVAFASTALLSNGGGLVTFFITVSTIIAVGRSLYLRAAGVLIAGAFVVGVSAFLPSPEGAGPAQSMVSARSIFVYVLVFFSNSLFSFSERGDDIYSLATGASVLVLTAYIVASSWREKNSSIFPYLLIGFSLASCLLIAYARLRGGIWQPNASRYYPFAAMLLVGTLLLLRSRKGKLRTRIALALFAAIFVSFVHSYFEEWRISPHRYVYSRSAHSSLCSGSSIDLAFHGDLRYTDTTALRAVFCTGQEAQMIWNKAQPVLIEMGPTQTRRNTAFNTQPDGESALWMRTENCESSCTIVFSDIEVPTVASRDGTLLTARIPKALYEWPGERAVYVKNTRSGKRSQTLLFNIL